MDRRIRRAEVYLDIPFGWRLSVDLSVAVDERQILSLFGREPHLIFSSSVNNWKVSFMSLYVWPYFPDILILVVT